MPWRSCVPTHVAKSSAIGFDARDVPVSPAGPPERALRDHRDFVTYDQSTQARLNGDGVCFTRRNYPSPK